MSDLYQAIANSSVGKTIFGAVNLPIPTILERYQPEQASFVTGEVLIGSAPGSTATPVLLDTLAQASDIQLKTIADLETESTLKTEGEKAGLKVESYNPDREDKQSFKALIFDATGIDNTRDLHALWAFFHPVIRKLQPCARVIVIGRTPEQCTRQQHIAQRGLQGFIKAVGKEIKKGATANLIYAAPDAEQQLSSAVQFFSSAKSAYVSGQVVRVRASETPATEVNWHKPLTGKTVLVTGAARGIGAAIAQVMARDGAKVIALDIPPMADDLKQVATDIGGIALEADITSDDTPENISNLAKEQGGLDVIIHNAGVTRDKTLAGMPDKFWDMVIDINIAAEERINERLLADATLNQGGRIICVSSISGIAGNMGQTNYATSKAAVIGMVESMREELWSKQITINAVAPGFIETQMTAAIPFTIREAGRRMNSMSQGGQPVDVAETIGFFASPASRGVTGNVVRVCGQSLIGA